MPEPHKSLVITRVIQASREKVWRAFTEPDALKHWWGQPKGATMPVCTVDFKVDGSFHYQVLLLDGKSVWGKGVYKEIVPMDRLVFVDTFSNEDGNVVITSELPKKMIAVKFENADGGTKITIRHSGIDDGSATVSQYEQGWNESLDKLVASL